MPWIIGGAVLGGALLSGAASNAASKRQANAANSASQVQQNMYDQTREDLSPYRRTGELSLNKLQELLQLQGDPMQSDLLRQFSMEDFEESPAYQFNLQQGMEAINKSAAAKGKYYAPATLQDIGKYSQGLASNEFQNALGNFRNNQGDIWSRLSGLAGMGQNAATQTGQFGAQAAGQIGENMIGAGNARAAGLVGSANAINTGIGDAYNNYLLSQVLGQRQEPTYGASNDMASYGGGLRR